MLKIMKHTDLAASEDVINIPDVPSRGGLDFQSAGEHGEGAKIKQFYDHALEEAKQKSVEMSRKMIEHANANRNEIIEQAHKEALEICEEARKKGYAEGVKERAGEIDNCFSEIDEVLEQMLTEQNQFMKDYSSNIQLLAVEIAGKVLATKIEQDEIILAELVRKAIGTVKDADWMSVELSDKLPRLVEYLSQDLHKREQQLGIKRIEFSAENTEIGSCIIRTEDGTVDASVSTQLKNLVECFNRIK